MSIVFQQDQQIYVAIHTGLTAGFRAVEYGLRVGRYASYHFRYTLYYLGTFHDLAFPFIILDDEQRY